MDVMNPLAALVFALVPMSGSTTSSPVASAFAQAPTEESARPAPRANPRRPVERDYAEASPIPKLRFERLVPNQAFVRPVQAVRRPGDDVRLYVVEQPGRVLLVDPSRPSGTDAPVFLDVRERVNDGGNEEGLLSIAFHPDFPRKRELYAYYTASKPRRSILSRFTVSEDGTAADPASEEVLLTCPQPYTNHNGGTVLFGPDGFLYLSYGDGGAANDPHHYGQDLSSLLGKVIRIDVGTKGPSGEPYAVPADNPFVATEGARPEIWALGTRNVWRMAFDPKLGTLWAGDVGQNAWEEISIIEKGGNYGWNAREGFQPFPGGRGEGPFKEPVVQYGHREGLSVTGGQVYRGSAIPALDGVYVYADFVSSRVWGIRMVDGVPTRPAVIASKPGALISSIDTLADGTLVVCAFDGAQDRGNPGSLWKLVAAPE